MDEFHNILQNVELFDKSEDRVRAAQIGHVGKNIANLPFDALFVLLEEERD